MPPYNTLHSSYFQTFFTDADFHTVGEWPEKLELLTLNTDENEMNCELVYHGSPYQLCQDLAVNPKSIEKLEIKDEENVGLKVTFDADKICIDDVRCIAENLKSLYPNAKNIVVVPSSIDVSTISLEEITSLIENLTKIKDEMTFDKYL